MPRVVKFLGYSPYPLNPTFGQWLSSARANMGYSRKRLGRRYQLDESTLWHLETGQSQPTQETQDRLRALMLSFAERRPIPARKRTRTGLLRHRLPNC